MSDPYEFDGLEVVLGLVDLTAREWDRACATWLGVPAWQLAESRLPLDLVRDRL